MKLLAPIVGILGTGERLLLLGEPMIDLPGYQMGQCIHESSRSLVYRGSRWGDERPVILKILRQDCPNPAMVARWRQEYDITRSLQSIRGVVKTYELLPFHNRWILVLEDVGGGSLLHWIKDGPLPIDKALGLLIEISRILAEVHDHQVIHKDINPANWVYDPQTERITLIDFGLASLVPRETQHLQSPHQLSGTLAYLSPEQTGRMNRALDYRTDFYSLGVTAYQLLTGSLPFAVTDPMELLHCHLARHPLPPHQQRPEIPEALSALVMKLMAKTAEDRYQSARGLQADLEHCCREWQSAGSIGSFTLGLRDRSDRFEIPPKLFGREAEIAQLEQICEHSGSPQVLWVSGEPGIGKSALIREIYKPMSQRRGVFLSGKFDQLQRNIPYSALVQAMRGWVLQRLAEPPEVIREWKERLQFLLDQQGQMLLEVIPELGWVIGPQPSLPPLDPRDAQNRFQRLVQSFLQSVIDSDRFVVLFIDDLQWADPASLQLLQKVLVSPDALPLLLIGAYRPDELTPSMQVLLDGIHTAGVSCHSIHLGPLRVEAVGQLLQETLTADAQTVAPLAEQVLHKTGGNPFFVTQFLLTLAREGYFVWNATAGGWHWDPTQIEGAGITANVVKLMIQTLEKLPAITQNLLSLAACMGEQFGLSTLAMVSELKKPMVFHHLLPALQQDLIISITTPLGHLVANSGQDSGTEEGRLYSFAHDRIQQAAYSLIEPPQRAIVHHRIGGLLWVESEANQEDQLFALVYHLNAAQAVITDPLEQDCLVRLNHQAGWKAMASGAFEPALSYFSQAAALWGLSRWSSDPDLTFEIYLKRAECDYLTGNWEAVEPQLQNLLDQPLSSLQRMEIFSLRLETLCNAGQYEEVLSLGIQELRSTGWNLPTQGEPLSVAINQELAGIRTQWHDHSIQQLMDWPPLQDEGIRLQLKVLGQMSVAAYFANQPLEVLLFAAMTRLSIQHGNSDLSAMAYVGFGNILQCRLADPQRGYAFGQVGIGLSERFGNPALKGRAMQLFCGFIDHWHESVLLSYQRSVQAFQDCLAGGALVTAGFCATFMCYRSLLKGDPLDQAALETQHCLDYLKRIRYEAEYPFPILCLQFIRALQGSTEAGWSLNDENFQEEPYVDYLRQQGWLSALHLFYTLKAQLLYLFDRVEAGWLAAEKAEQLEWTSVGQLRTSERLFYQTLLALQRVERDPNLKDLRQDIGSWRDQLEAWATQGADHLQLKVLIVQAEIARLEHRELEGLDYFDQALALARQQKVRQVEGLIHERLAKLWQPRRQFGYGLTHLKEAYYAYQSWGSHATSAHLEQQVPRLRVELTPTHSPSWLSTTSSSRTQSTWEDLDLTTVLKACQALASEIRLEQVLIRLIRILLENAGAQTGYLMLEQDGELWIEAQATLDSLTAESNPIQVLHSQPLSAAVVPTSVIYYVVHSQESVVLQDALLDGTFGQDPYIQTQKPKSLLCAPILSQSRLIGLLYLENRLTVGTFTSERLEVLRIISTQAAISLDNARLYEQMEARVQERTQALAQEIQERTQAEVALRLSEKKFSKAFQACPDGILLSDLASGLLLEANDSFLSLSGYTPEEVIGKTAAEVSIWADPRERANLFLLLESKESVRNFEARINTKHGETKIALISAEIVDLEGQKCLLSITKDITELKRVEQLKKEFVSVVSHELRTPLTSIRGSLGLITGGVAGILPPEAKTLIDIAHKNSERLVLLINDILDIEKIESGKMTFELAPLELIPQLQLAVDTNRAYADQLGVQLTLDPGPTQSLWIRADHHRFQQVMANLLSNAAKFSPAQGQVSVSMERQDRHVVIRVHDQGIGIPAEFRRRIFQKFAQADATTTRQKGGTGLGLSICKALVEQMGGQIGFEAGSPEGTTFYFTVPLNE